MKVGRSVLAILLLAIVACVGAQVLPAAELNIVPRPVTAKMLPGVFRLSGETRIVAADQETHSILLKLIGNQFGTEAARKG